MTQEQYTARYNELMLRSKRTLYTQYVAIMAEFGYVAEAYERIGKNTLVFHIIGSYR